MSLEEPGEANAEGLKLALENSMLKLGLNIERKNREVFLFEKKYIFLKKERSLIFQYTSSISTKNFKKFLFQSIEFKTNFF